MSQPDVPPPAGAKPDPDDPATLQALIISGYAEPSFNWAGRRTSFRTHWIARKNCPRICPPSGLRRDSSPIRSASSERASEVSMWHMNTGQNTRACGRT